MGVQQQGPGRSPVVVVGAGPSGLATAAMLRRARVPAVVLERAAGVGASWRDRYDHLALHTHRTLSGLPGLRVPRQAGPWVSRDAWVRYLEHYAAHHQLTVRTGTEVRRLRPPDGPPGSGPVRWQVHTADGVLPARAVVVATGRNHSPHIPPWPGRGSFRGTLLHSCEYRGPGTYRGRTVLVVGAGNSGAEIADAVARAGAAKVWLAVRTPPTIVPRSIGRFPAPGSLVERIPPALGDRASALLQRATVPDLAPYGLPRPSVGMFTRNAREGISPVLDHGIADAVRTGLVEPVAAVVGLDGDLALLADGGRLSPELVITATGYRSGLEELLGPLGVLSPDGLPVPRGARTSPHAPHLYFVGYANPLGGALRRAGIEGRGIARALRHGTAAAVPSPRTAGPG